MEVFMEESAMIQEGSVWECIRPRDHRGFYRVKRVMANNVALQPLDSRLPRQQQRRTIILAKARFLAGHILRRP